MKWLRMLLVAGVVWMGAAFAQADTADPAQVAQTTAQSTIDKSLVFLKTRQKPDFGWQESYEPPGITALVLRAFIADDKYDTGQPFLQKGFGKLLSYQVDAGGIYKDTLACYNTAIAISALAESKDAAYHDALQKRWTICAACNGPTPSRACPVN